MLYHFDPEFAGKAQGKDEKEFVNSYQSLLFFFGVQIDDVKEL